MQGCKAYILKPKPLRNKLENQTYEHKFIGQLDNISGYRFYHNKKGLIERRDAIFVVVKQVNPLEK